MGTANFSCSPSSRECSEGSLACIIPHESLTRLTPYRPLYEIQLSLCPRCLIVTRLPEVRQDIARILPGVKP